jgi:hypothetical protein
MFTMMYDIEIGGYKVGVLDGVEVRRSVETLADSAVIKLPAAEYNAALEVEDKIHRGDTVRIRLGYEEVGMTEEFSGYVQRIGTDNDTITVECEDSLYNFRKELKDAQYKDISLQSLLKRVIAEIGGGYTINSTYSWSYSKFVVSCATAYDVLKKVQEESGSDIYLEGKTLHIHAPGEKIGKDVLYDFSQNVQKCDLKYCKAEDRKVKVVVKALLPDGKVKEIETGSTGGTKIEVKCAANDDKSMKERGNAEVKRRSFDGYEGSITTWLFPVVMPGDSAQLHDKDYDYKDGKYFVKAVTTTFDSSGASRKVELGFRLS